MSLHPQVSDSFRRFLIDAPEHSGVWMDMVEKLGHASKLDPKTQTLCYVAVLAALRLTSGIPFHVAHARALGATRDEVIGAVLIGLPAVGNAVVESLVPALAQFDEPNA